MNPSAIREQVDKILQSRSFANKGQLRRLLQVLHKHMQLENEITSDLVIRELWPSEIRTKRPADVATEMNRLRHALKTYYEEEGSRDPVAITLPKRAGTAEGAREQPWIVAAPRARERPEPGPQAHENSRKRWKIAVLITAICAGISVAAYVSVRAGEAPNPPQSARLDGTVLRIMGADGKELWSKNFPDGFSTDWYYEKGIATRIWFGDLEGNGHTSVLFSYLPGGRLSMNGSTLICYSDRGKEKWRWTPGRELPELNGSPPTYATWAVALLKGPEKRPVRIIVLSQHQPWWPSQMAVLDPSGKILSEYWHSGGLSYMILADLDGDGRQEIIATGISEYDHQATLVILDPDRVFGASKEVRPGFQIHGMGEAQERLRLLFPRSDMNRALFQFNDAIEPTFDHGNLRLTVAECITPVLDCRIYYEFDRHFRLIAAYAGSDEFRSAHERFYQSGKEAHRLGLDEEAAFQKVRCLVGCKSEYVEVGKLIP